MFLVEGAWRLLLVLSDNHMLRKQNLRGHLINQCRSMSLTKLSSRLPAGESQEGRGVLTALVCAGCRASRHIRCRTRTCPGHAYIGVGNHKAFRMEGHKHAMPRACTLVCQYMILLANVQVSRRCRRRTAVSGCLLQGKLRTAEGGAHDC